MLIKGSVILAAVLIDQLRKDEDSGKFAIKCIPWVAGIFAGAMAVRMIPDLTGKIIGVIIFAGVGFGGQHLMNRKQRMGDHR